MNRPVEPRAPRLHDEWLEADGLGGFASGTTAGIRTRRYHAHLLVATTPPTGRVLLVNGYEAWVEFDGGRFALSSQRYAPDVVHPDGRDRIESFEAEPWPNWTYRLEDGTQIRHEVFALHGLPLVAATWRIIGPPRGATLTVRPLLSGRDPHVLHHENPAFRFGTESSGRTLTWRPYHGVPGILNLANGEYQSLPEWYRGFLYEEERARGLDHTEDLASPGLFRFDLGAGEAVWIAGADTEETRALMNGAEAPALLASLREAEGRRRRFPSRLHRAADAYIVRRGAGKTIVAGYPWFADWGRDTFIAMRGLCIAAGRLQDAQAILIEWARAVSEGMLPNRFADQGDAPEFNSVDASLWYVVAVHDLLRAAEITGQTVSSRDRGLLASSVEAILDGYATGTRYGIHMDSDGLLAAGVPSVPLTWMDVMVGDRVVTPRIGKPVEVQALWLNALRIADALSGRWFETHARGLASFRQRFWNERRGCLFDVVDVDHRPGEVDATLRPNQIFAVGGLPFQVLEGERALRVVEVVERALWTPIGLRSLEPKADGYAPRYEGGVAQRDGAYHQGTVWPWLAGPFIEAWVRVRGGALKAQKAARSRFLEPLLAHLDEAGLGHISEIADAEPPYTPRGCPFQAWSVGEALRLDQEVMRETAATKTVLAVQSAGSRSS